MKKKIKKKRLFSKIVGTNKKPRISVFRSNKHLYIQAIDDQNHKTITALSTTKLKANKTYLNKQECEKAGQIFGESLKNKEIQLAVFDKNGKRYHGRIATIADTIRNSGIQF